MQKKCDCCSESSSDANSKQAKNTVAVPYVCYCNHVTEEDIKRMILNGSKTAAEVIKNTGAMRNSNCAVNNPKGVCCYQDIVDTCEKYL